jgi:hypothetical protein
MKSGTGNRKSARPPHRALPIGDYALISDCHCAALVSILTLLTMVWCMLFMFGPRVVMVAVCGSCAGRSPARTMPGPKGQGMEE